ncbi:DNA-binding transcriptional regulator [Ralstonia pickettii]|uniref:DNA-binding transcriptional regulator n=1 Tax=Ralstonia pickettii TaxID=329 RepID=A0A2N4TTM6_RALPI|nr:sugar-binding transcriptional regulator [Ralstonia pickettii]PLC43067.1 DNA-binding transcriptional regulator [Ralstonia pickettii]
MSKQQEKRDQAARAAWLYYVGNHTQHDIAEQLGVSRQIAQRLVAYAVEHGLVKVRVTHPVSTCLELAESLRSRFRLETCHVVPTHADDADAAQRMIAVAAAEIMERHLLADAPRVVNVGSGRTLRAAIDQLPDLDRPQHRIVSMVGAIAADGSSNRYDVALAAAEKTRSRYYLLPAPLVADSAEDTRQWCHHRLYGVVADLAAQADVTFIGVGTIGPGCPLQVDGFISAKDVDDLLAHGAAGELIGRPIDAQGRLLDVPLQTRITSLPLKPMPSRPVIAVAGSVAKAGAIGAALRGGWLTGLVTDEACAQRILAALD